MVSKEKPSVWLDLDAAANDNDPIPRDFANGSENPVDPRVLEIASGWNLTLGTLFSRQQ